MTKQSLETFECKYLGPILAAVVVFSAGYLQQPLPTSHGKINFTFSCVALCLVLIALAAIANDKVSPRKVFSCFECE